MIRDKSGLGEREFSVFIEVLKLRVGFVPLEEFVGEVSEAVKLAPHLKDVEYFALALSLGCGLWSEEKAFKRQSRVEVFNTRELVELLGSVSSQDFE